MFITRYKLGQDPIVNKMQQEKLAIFLSSLETGNSEDINEFVVGQSIVYSTLPKNGPYFVEISCRQNNYSFTYQERDAISKDIEIWPCDKKYFDQIQKIYHQVVMMHNKS